MGTILVADEHSGIRVAARTTLCQHGHEVRLAASPESAFSVLETWAPDVGLFEIEFRHSRLTGFDLLDFVRSHCPHTRVIMTSGHDDSAIRTAVCKSGGAGFVSKTEAWEVIVQAIGLVLAGGRWFPNIDSGMLAKLTTRQVEIVRLLTEGRVLKEVARDLRISMSTVKFHLKRARRSMSVRTNCELVATALRNGGLLTHYDRVRSTSSGSPTMG